MGEVDLEGEVLGLEVVNLLQLGEGMVCTVGELLLGEGVEGVI